MRDPCGESSEFRRRCSCSVNGSSRSSVWRSRWRCSRQDVRRRCRPRLLPLRRRRRSQRTAAAAGRSRRCAVHGGAHFDSARPVFHVALGSHRQRHQRVHQPGRWNRAEHRQQPRQPERFHHLYPDRHRSGRIRHRHGHGQRVRAAAAPASAARRRPTVTIDQRLAVGRPGCVLRLRQDRHPQRRRATC